MSLEVSLNLLYTAAMASSTIFVFLLRIRRVFRQRYDALEKRLLILETRDIHKTDQMEALREDLHEIKDTLHIIRNALINKGLKNA